MFKHSAAYYDAVYSFKDYRKEAEMLLELVAARNPGAHTLLDVGCGTGMHLSLLQASFDCEGIDLDEDLLAIAHERLPKTPLHRGDMASFDLGKRFDVLLCLFGAIAYVQTADNLNAAVASMARHLNPGGLLIVEPWIGPEKFNEGYVGYLDVKADDLKLARMSTTKREGELARLIMHYLVGTTGKIEHFVEEHLLGLFGIEQYESAFQKARLDAEYDPEGPMGRGLFIAKRA